MSRKKTRSNRRLTTNRATAIGSTRPGSRNATSYGVKKSTTTSRMTTTRSHQCVHSELRGSMTKLPSPLAFLIAARIESTLVRRPREESPLLSIRSCSTFEACALLFVCCCRCMCVLASRPRVAACMRVAATPASSVVGVVTGVSGTLRLTAESRMEGPQQWNTVADLLTQKLRAEALSSPEPESSVCTDVI